MNHTQIACFLAGAQSESFAVAADSMYMSPPTFGRQIASLEQELGFALFERGWKNNQLTPAGAIMAEGFQKLSMEYNLLLSRAINVSQNVSGTLVIGMLEGQLIDPGLQSVLHEFQTQFPGVSLTLQRYSFHGMLDALENGELDAGITLSVELLGRGEYNTMALFSAENELVLSTENPLSGRSGLTLSDFAGETFIEIEQMDSPIIAGLMLDSCKRAGFVPNIQTVPDLRAQIMAVELGQGIAAFNKYHQTYHHPSLSHIPVPELPAVEFSLVWKKSAANPVLPCIVTMFQTHFQKSL